MQECKERIKNLEVDISKGKKGLKAIIDEIISCEIQLKITLNELSQCQEMLRVNKESMNEEKIKMLQDKVSIAQKVHTAAVKSFAASWGVAALSILSGS